MSFNIFHHHSKHSRPSSPQVGSTEELQKHSDHTHEESSAPKTHHSPNRVGSPRGVESPRRADSPRREDSPSVLAKFLADPFRSTSRPDHVGEFIDPMGGRDSPDTSKDPMSTGA
jgi:hypothetical protein